MNRRIVIVVAVLVALLLAGAIIHAWPTSHPRRPAGTRPAATAPARSSAAPASAPTAVTVCHRLAVAAGTDPANATEIRKLASPKLAASLIEAASRDPLGHASAPSITVVPDGSSAAIEQLPGGVTLVCTVKAGKVVSLS